MSGEHLKPYVTNVSFPPIGKSSAVISSKPRGYIAPENQTRIQDGIPTLPRSRVDSGFRSRESGVHSVSGSSVGNREGLAEKKLIEDQFNLVEESVSNTDGIHRQGLWLESLAIHNPVGSTRIQNQAVHLRNVDADIAQSETAFLTDVAPASTDTVLLGKYVNKISLQEGRIQELDEQNGNLHTVIGRQEDNVKEYKDLETVLAKTTHEKNELLNSRDLFLSKYEKAELYHQKCKSMVDSLTEQLDILREDKAAVDRSLIERHREHEVLQEASKHTQKMANDVLNGSLLTSQIELITCSQKEEVAKSDLLTERLELAKKEYNLLLLTVQRLSLECNDQRDKCAQQEHTLQHRQEHLVEVLEPYTPRPNWKGLLVEHAHIESLGHVMGVSLDTDEVKQELGSLQDRVQNGQFCPDQLLLEQLPVASPALQQPQPEQTLEERVLMHDASEIDSSAKNVGMLLLTPEPQHKYSTMECVERVFEYVDVLVTRNSSLESEVKSVLEQHQNYKIQNEADAANQREAEATPLVPYICASNRKCLTVDQSGIGVQYTHLGSGREVPEIQRLVSTVPIRRRTMQRKECEVLLTEFWSEKRASDIRRGHLECHPLIHLHTYLRAQLGLQAQVVETAYNLLDALNKQQKANGIIRASYYIMTSVTPEESMLDQDLMIAAFSNMMKMLNVLRSKVSGIVPLSHCTHIDVKLLESFIAHQRDPTPSSMDSQSLSEAESATASTTNMLDESCASINGIVNFSFSGAGGLGSPTVNEPGSPGMVSNELNPLRKVTPSRLPLWLLAYWIESFFPCKSIAYITQIVQFIGNTFSSHPDTVTDYDKQMRNQRENGGLFNLLRLQDAEECVEYLPSIESKVLVLLEKMKVEEGIADIQLVYNESDGQVIDVVCPVVLLQAAWMRVDTQNSLSVLSHELSKVCGTNKLDKRVGSVKNQILSIKQEGRPVRPRCWTTNIPDRIALWVNRLTDPLLVEYLVEEGLNITDIKAQFFGRKDTKTKKNKKLGKTVKDPLSTDPYTVEQSPEIFVTDICEPINYNILDRSQYYGVPPVLIIQAESSNKE